MARRSSEERNAQARAQLQPLAPGERPRAVTVAAIVAAVLALGNVTLYLVGFEVRGEEPQPAGVFVLSGLLALGAGAMWRTKYWAVLGFQVFMAVTAVFAGLSLMVASNWQGAVRSLLVLLGAGTLFFFLIKAMARLQMPQRPGGR